MTLTLVVPGDVDGDACLKGAYLQAARRKGNEKGQLAVFNIYALLDSAYMDY